MTQNSRAQTMLEYVFLIAVLAAGLILMVHFLQMRIQGRMKNEAEQISGGRQFEQGTTTTTIRVSAP